jgi:hypothetical protein
MVIRRVTSERCNRSPIVVTLNIGIDGGHGAAQRAHDSIRVAGGFDNERGGTRRRHCATEWLVIRAIDNAVVHLGREILQAGLANDADDRRPVHRVAERFQIVFVDGR